MRGVLPSASPSVPPGLECLSWTAAEIQLASEASSLINDFSMVSDHMPPDEVPSMLRSAVWDDLLTQARLMADEHGSDMRPEGAFAKVSGGLDYHGRPVMVVPLDNAY